MSYHQGDTIVAISTPRGFSGIGVIRMSGPDSGRLLKSIFISGSSGKGSLDRRAIYGRVVDPDTKETIDDGIAIVMAGPNSYTGEDIAELYLHGSPFILETVQRILINRGARLAKRGEFTLRAFLSGRMDLAQAEAVIDVIEASSMAGLREARAAMDSKISLKTRALSNSIKDLLAELEAHIDFDEDDERPRPDTLGPLNEIASAMDEMVRAAHSARPRRDGIRTVIIGKPNVGKSTLFNALVGDDRAIVTPYPGTTRDVIDERLMVADALLMVSDTAGIRLDPESIESQGINRAMARANEADILVLTLDVSRPLDQEDERLLSFAQDKRCLIVLNKIDKCLAEPSFKGPHWIDPDRILKVSALNSQGLSLVLEALGHMAKEILSVDDDHDIGSLNKRAALLMEQALESVKRPLSQMNAGVWVEPELLAISLRTALDAMGEITGESVDHGILDRVFERFCIGK